MVSPLTWKSRDPMGMKRGKGFYYKRSYKGNTNWFSKYSGEIDGARRDSKKTNVKKRYDHAGDRSITKRRTAKMPQRRGRPKKLFGWF